MSNLSAKNDVTNFGTHSYDVQLPSFRHKRKRPDLVGSHYDPTYGVEWVHIKSDAPAKFTRPLLAALRERQIDVEVRIRQDLNHGAAPCINYQVFSSQVPNVFSLGGDLVFFIEKIKKKDHEGLLRYARDALDLVYNNVVNYKLPLTTISLVQGSALGGGFEAALANNVVIAERHCQMGLPEILFNMFPGMGAYQLLCHRLPPHQAEKIILSGRTYTAEELYEIGLVDVLADTGKGEQAVWDYIKASHSKLRGRNSLHKAIRAVDPIDYESFTEIANTWVEAAMDLSDADIKTMDLLVRAQRRNGH